MDASRVKKFARENWPMLVIGGAIGAGFDSLALAMCCAFTVGVVAGIANIFLTR